MGATPLGSTCRPSQNSVSTQGHPAHPVGNCGLVQLVLASRCNSPLRWAVPAMQAHDLQEWAENPEGFHHEAEAGGWEEHPRACAERLLMLLVKARPLACAALARKKLLQYGSSHGTPLHIWCPKSIRCLLRKCSRSQVIARRIG